MLAPPIPIAADACEQAALTGRVVGTCVCLHVLTDIQAAQFGFDLV